MMPIADRYLSNTVCYRKGGRSIRDGLDCYGLVMHFYKEQFDIDLVDPLAATREELESYQYERDELIEGACMRGFVRVGVSDELAMGDVIELPREHLGVYIGGKYILHCGRPYGVSVMPLGRARIKSIWRHESRQ